MPAVISSELCSVEPPIILVTVAGRLTLPAMQNSREFGNLIRSLGGKPYRVLCDFTQTITMSEDVCAVFMRGQAFAVEHGMERDAFACTSSVLRLQFVRIARESGRFDRLGSLQFFDSVEQARVYLEAPVSETHETAASRRLQSEHGQGAPSRRSLAADTTDGAPSRRALAPEFGSGPPSRGAPAFSLRAAAPSRRHSRG